MQSVYTLFVKARNLKDEPEQTTKEQEAMDAAEEKVLRYVAGYTSFALLKKFTKQTNPTA